MDCGKSHPHQAAEAQDHDPIEGVRRDATYRVRITCGAVALALIALGLAARVWRHYLELSEDNAGIVAASLALAATLYAGVLMLWDRQEPDRF